MDATWPKFCLILLSRRSEVESINLSSCPQDVLFASTDKHMLLTQLLQKHVFQLIANTLVIAVPRISSALGFQAISVVGSMLWNSL